MYFCFFGILLYLCTNKVHMYMITLSMKMLVLTAFIVSKCNNFFSLLFVCAMYSLCDNQENYNLQMKNDMRILFVYLFIF